MVVGPIPISPSARTAAYWIILLIAVPRPSLAIPVFLRMRPHWRDLLRLEQTAHQLGEGNLSIRSQLAADSRLSVSAPPSITWLASYKP